MAIIDIEYRPTPKPKVTRNPFDTPPCRTRPYSNVSHYYSLVELLEDYAQLHQEHLSQR